MADFRLIIISVILSVFSIASNSLLYKEREHLSKSDKNFALVSIIGSVLILLAALFFGFKNKGAARNAAANQLNRMSGRIRNY